VKVPLLDLKAQYASIRREVEEALAGVFAEQQFVLGPWVERFEQEMERYTGARHAIGVASGSDALLLALMALGIGPRDAVVTTPFTFFATAGAVARTGARLVFADVEPQSLNLCPRAAAETMERRPAPPGRWVLLPVHLYGRAADLEAFSSLARRFGAALVEDAAQALGARSRPEGGPRAGTVGDCGALSFFPSKNLGGAGDGGMILTNDDELAARVRMLRVHGSARERYVHERIGINSRLDAIQAAVLSVKLRRLDEWNRKRRQRAAFYTRRLEQEGLVPKFVRPPREAGEAHVFHQYVIRAERRDALRSALARAGVATQVYYPRPLHLQPCFADLGYERGDFPEAERAAEECLALPMYPELEEDQIEHVVRAIAAFYRRGG
jgi:dTDP-4-amino-4,6-dideoxygalactose transaminase